ncbi:MAG: C1 family peptidase [bacterium]|nr:C1 family peptidase [bacterium]
MIRAVICLLLLATTTYCVEHDVKAETTHKILDNLMNGPTKDLFKAYHLLFDKTEEYELNSEEGIKRYRIFKQNVKEIKEHNAKGLSWTEGINQFSDLTIEEFGERYLMTEQDREEEKRYLRQFSLDDYNDNEDNVSRPATQNNNDQALANVDHRDYQKVARSQGRCGSCWAFACSSATETNHAKEHSKAPFYLSPQQMVDCSRSNGGCRGGSAGRGMSYIRDEGGLVKDEEYKYTARKGSCNINSNAERFEIKSYESSYRKPIDQWHANLSKGAGYIRVDAYTIFRYRGGVLRFSQCSRRCNRTNHAMVGTGWSYESGKGVVLVRNSWGTRWGEQGYIRAYYEPEEKDTCYLTAYFYRPVPDDHDTRRK